VARAWVETRTTHIISSSSTTRPFSLAIRFIFAYRLRHLLSGNIPPAKFSTRPDPDVRVESTEIGAKPPKFA
jgi:hypothetical protein